MTDYHKNRKLREVACSTCGAKIIRYKYGTCGDCQKKAKREGERLRIIREVGLPRRCKCTPECGKVFLPTRNAQKYHPDCRLKVKHARRQVESAFTKEKRLSEEQLQYAIKGRQPVTIGSLNQRMSAEKFTRQVNRLLRGE